MTYTERKAYSAEGELLIYILSSQQDDESDHYSFCEEVMELLEDGYDVRVTVRDL